MKRTAKKREKSDQLEENAWEQARGPRKWAATKSGFWLFWVHIVVILRFVATLLLYLTEVYCLMRVCESLFGKVGFTPHTWLRGFGLWRRTVEALLRNRWISELYSLLDQALHVSDCYRSSLSESVGAVIVAIGVGGIAITWLNNAADRRTYGVRTGELICWAHRGFYPMYGLVSLPTVFLGVFAGNAHIWEAVLFALIGVVIELLFLLWICFKCVISTFLREDLALQYYAYYLRLGPWTHLRRLVHPLLDRFCWRFNKSMRWEQLREKFRYEEEKECQNRETYITPIYLERTRSTVFSTANYTKEQYLIYHRNISERMVRLWGISFPVPKREKLSAFQEEKETLPEDETKKQHPPVAYISDAEDTIVANTFLFRDMWTEMLKNGDPAVDPLQLAMVRQILHHTVTALKNEGQYIPLVLGLLLYLEEAIPNRNDLMDSVYQIIWQEDVSRTKEQVPNVVRFDMAWGLLMLLEIQLVYKDKTDSSEDREDTLCTAYYLQRFEPVLNEYFSQVLKSQPTHTAVLKPQRSTFFERHTDVFLLYAEWSARLRRGVSLTQYMLWQSSWYNDIIEQGYYNLRDFGYRRFILTNLLYTDR